MIKLKSLLEDKTDIDNYYYHITLFPYISSIKQHGLKTSGVKNTVSNYKEYSKRKIFLCEVGVVDYWVNKIGEHAFHSFDDEQFHNVAIFRVLKTHISNIEKDEVGSKDSGGNCYYTTQNIPSQFLEFVKIIEEPY